MLSRSRPQRPGEDHHPGQAEAKRPRAGIRDVRRQGHAEVRDECHGEPEDGDELRPAREAQNGVDERELGRVGEAEDELQPAVGERHRVEREPASA